MLYSRPKTKQKIIEKIPLEIKVVYRKTCHYIVNFSFIVSVFELLNY